MHVHESSHGKCLWLSPKKNAFSKPHFQSETCINLYLPHNSRNLTALLVDEVYKYFCFLMLKMHYFPGTKKKKKKSSEYKSNFKCYVAYLNRNQVTRFQVSKWNTTCTLHFMAVLMSLRKITCIHYSLSLIHFFFFSVKSPYNQRKWLHIELIKPKFCQGFHWPHHS